MTFYALRSYISRNNKSGKDWFMFNANGPYILFRGVDVVVFLFFFLFAILVSFS